VSRVTTTARSAARAWSHNASASDGFADLAHAEAPSRAGPLPRCAASDDAPSTAKHIARNGLKMPRMFIKLHTIGQTRVLRSCVERCWLRVPVTGKFRLLPI